MRRGTGTVTFGSPLPNVNMNVTVGLPVRMLAGTGHANGSVYVDVWLPVSPTLRGMDLPGPRYQG